MIAAFLVGCRPDGPERLAAQLRWGSAADRMDTVPLHLMLAQLADMDSGCQVPGPEEGGALRLRITLPTGTGADTSVRYAVYYRNEDYRFPERDEDGYQHPQAHENFYGMWAEGFTVAKAANGLDGTLIVRSDPRKEFKGGAWQRNPRVGRYSLLVVAVERAAIATGTIPPGVLDITDKSAQVAVEPYWYWLYGPGSTRKDVRSLLIPHAFTVRARFDASSGVHGCTGVGGAFAPFAHYIDPASALRNIPVVRDVMAGYSDADYDSLVCFTREEELIPLTPSIAADSCGNARLDTVAGCIILANPAVVPGQWRKENAGVRTRTALTYGRHLVHVQLTELLNDSGLWNGLTNAVWLIGAGGTELLRRPCDGGYMAYASDGAPRRIDRSGYVEIDFEIMKGVPLCPSRSFPPIYPQPVADAAHRPAWRRVLPAEVVQQRGQVAVALTNWDLACPSPPEFNIGCHELVYEGKPFSSHRWDWDYRAITQKEMAADDELFGEGGYWFCIDWRPTEIIWRIGPDPEHLRVVGYMNDRMTSIPDLPMHTVITQEFHNTQWWPGSPYEQGGVPFPAKELVGRVFEVRVE